MRHSRDLTREFGEGTKPVVAAPLVETVRGQEPGALGTSGRRPPPDRATGWSHPGEGLGDPPGRRREKQGFLLA